MVPSVLFDLNPDKESLLEGSNFCQKPRGFKQTSETGRRLLCKLKTDNQPCPCIISLALLFHSDIWEQMQAWNFCLVQITHSSPNTCHFVKTFRVCHFWPPSHHLPHFTVKIVRLFLDIEGVQVFYSQVT